MIFSDRKQAGRLLADKLIAYKKMNPIVLALPRGGVPVAAEIAAQLSAPLNVLIVRKVAASFQTELAMGALCEDDKPCWNMRLLSRMGLQPDDLSLRVQAEKDKIKQQIKTFRNGASLPAVANRVVIVVDDGLATGATLLAAVKHLKTKSPAKIIVAVPVAAASSARQMKSKVDELIVLEEREDLISVGQWYMDFSQVSDDEVVSLLKKRPERKSHQVEIASGSVKLNADVTTFSAMKALIIFTHGSGSGRQSERNKMVANQLHEAGFGTLLFDLLTEEEAKNRKNVFDIKFLSKRLMDVTHWVWQQPDLKYKKIGYFGASTGAGAAIQAAAHLTDREMLYAIVSRGGRPDLAGKADLAAVKVPILLIVGTHDVDVIELNRQAQRYLHNSTLSLIPKATHLFEEPGTLEEVAKQTVQWFTSHLGTVTAQPLVRSESFDENAGGPNI